VSEQQGGTLKAKECRDCGEEIERGRAQALPHVETCVHCQRRREMNGHFQRHRIEVQPTYAVGGEIETMVETIVRAN